MATILTDRQKEALDFIVQYRQEFEISPTLREIGKELGIRSTNGVNDHLLALERKGWLAWPHKRKSRSFTLTTLTKKVYGLGLLMPEDLKILTELKAFVKKSLKGCLSPELESRLGDCSTPQEGAIFMLAEILTLLTRGEK